MANAATPKNMRRLRIFRAAMPLSESLQLRPLRQKERQKNGHAWSCTRRIQNQRVAKCLRTSLAVIDAKSKVRAVYTPPTLRHRHPSARSKLQLPETP